MSKNNSIPLKEVSINDLFYEGDNCTYEIPIYQRNYAWERDEISTLISDVNDSYCKDPQQVYYIGTLVAYNKGDNVFEVIDGQQRLTTIYLILRALFKEKVNNKLTYRARAKSDLTLKSIPDFDIDEVDSGIENGYKYACDELDGVATNEFKKYFLNKVHIIRYMVPRDIDLNHYFEIMNSRGEQLEKHEIIKANLMQALKGYPEDQHVFHKIWESCCEMNVYLQQKVDNASRLFSDDLYHFIPEDYDQLKALILDGEKQIGAVDHTMSISSIISYKGYGWEDISDDDDGKDTFQPIIDFPNFLLIVLKLVRLGDSSFSPVDFNLDDKELINEFRIAKLDPDMIRKFAFTLFRTKFLLDNYIVHHAKEEDSFESNPWKLQIWHKDPESKKEMLRNLVSDSGLQPLQDQLVHLLSMFEVSFTARQRKNYLVYCLKYLMDADINNFNASDYAAFLESLAIRYFNGVYMSKEKLSDANKPTPGSFDEVMLCNGKLNDSLVQVGNVDVFNEIYGDGTIPTKGIPLFVFNYTDYRLWKYYDDELRGEALKKDSRDRKLFFESLGCSDFGLDIFRLFYFSRTRRSLEHYYPQNTADGMDGHLNKAQINCFGNFSMIGAEANSSGSDWDPYTKLDHYMKDASKHLNRVSVASLKFWIMMQMCSDEGKWEFEQIQNHQQKMLNLLFGD